MTIQAIAWVLEQSSTRHSERLVMLSLANHADATGCCYPSLRVIAREANIDRDTAKKIVRALVGRGQIERQVQRAPDERIPRDKRPNLYRIIGGDDSTPPWLRGGDHSSVRGGSITPIGGDGSSPQTVIEPSKNRAELAAESGSALLAPEEAAARIRALRETL